MERKGRREAAFLWAPAGDVPGVQARGLRLRLDGISGFRLRDGRMVGVSMPSMPAACC